MEEEAELKEKTNYGRPINGMILVKRGEEVQASMGGIHIPPNAREKPAEGYVLVLGEEMINEHGIKFPHVVSVGDRIMFGKYAGIDVKIDGREFLMIKEDQIFMILPQKTEEQLQREEEAKSLLVSL